jgi:hypothetical protein
MNAARHSREAVKYSDNTSSLRFSVSLFGLERLWNINIAVFVFSICKVST